MLSIYRVVSLAFIALSLFQVVDALVVRRAPAAGSNGARLARRLPLARPKRLYDPLRRTCHSVPAGSLTFDIANIDVLRTDPSATPVSDTSRYV